MKTFGVCAAASTRRGVHDYRGREPAAGSAPHGAPDIGPIILDIASGAVLLVTFAAMPLLMIPAVVLLHGVIGAKMERSADDYACDTVGCEAMIGALEKIAEMNMAKRDTGRIFNLLTQHPSIDERIERLRERVAASSAAQTQAR